MFSKRASLCATNQGYSRMFFCIAVIPILSAVITISDFWGCPTPSIHEYCTNSMKPSCNYFLMFSVCCRLLQTVWLTNPGIRQDLPCFIILFSLFKVTCLGYCKPPCLRNNPTIFPTIFAHNFAHHFCPPCLPVRKIPMPLPPLAQPPKTPGNAARFGPVPLRRRTPRIIESHDLLIFLLLNMVVIFLVHVHNVVLSSCWLRAVEGFHFKPESQLNRLCSGLGSLSKWANFSNNN